jgi:PEP-CTERM motif
MIRHNRNRPEWSLSTRVMLTTALLAALSLASQAHAALYAVNFEDPVLSDDGLSIPNGYLGLNWGNQSIGTLEGNLYFTNESGYVFGAVDGPRTAYNMKGVDTSITSVDGTPFAYEQGTWSASFGSFDLTIAGYLHGVLQFETTRTIFQMSPTVISDAAFSGKAIDELRLTSDSGELPWALDHFQFSSPAPVPEPATIAFLLAGLMLLAGVARRRS